MRSPLNSNSADSTIGAAHYKRIDEFVARLTIPLLRRPRAAQPIEDNDMNRILIAFTTGMLLLAGNGFAAETIADIEVVRSIAETERKAIVADNMFFTSEEAEKFWPVYNEYREEARKVGDTRVQVIRNLANEFKTLDDARAEELLREVLDFQADRVKLRKSYVRKFNKVIPPKKTVRFFQIDSKLDAVIDFALATEIPLVN
jgi:hypothetical protein